MPRDECTHFAAALVHVLERAHKIRLADWDRLLMSCEAAPRPSLRSFRFVTETPGHIGRLQLD
jgi:hypothetical protein